MIESILLNYFAIKLPETMISEILSENPDIRKENDEGSLSDTCIRGQLIDTVTRKLKIDNWPTYGDTDEYSAKFYADLNYIVNKIGGKYYGEEL